MKIGVDRIKITPDTGIDLAGFERPGRKAVGIHDDLYMASMIIEDASESVLILCADLIGFSAELVLFLKAEIGRTYGFPEDRILLSASHTHSGPQTSENMLSVGEVDKSYLDILKGKVMDCIKGALADMTDAEIHCGLTSCKLGVNRRRLNDGVIEFAPDENGITDDVVTVLKVVDDSGLKAVMVNYACHPSIIDADLVSADFPGRARQEIQEALDTDIAVFFIQGFCGDIRAGTVEGREFRAGTWDDVDEYGSLLGKRVVEICKGMMQKLDSGISAKLLKVMLPLEALPEKCRLEELLENGTAPEKVWAARMLSRYGNLSSELPFTVQRITIGNMLHIIALSGEVCVDYDMYIRQHYRNGIIVPAGYSNGVTGYIPTGLMLRQGGYEPEGSILYYGTPSKFGESVEEMVKLSIDSIMS